MTKATNKKASSEEIIQQLTDEVNKLKDQLLGARSQLADLWMTAAESSMYPDNEVISVLKSIRFPTPIYSALMSEIQAINKTSKSKISFSALVVNQMRKHIKELKQPQIQTQQ